MIIFKEIKRLLIRLLMSVSNNEQLDNSGYRKVRNFRNNKPIPILFRLLLPMLSVLVLVRLLDPLKLLLIRVISSILTTPLIKDCLQRMKHTSVPTQN